MLQLLLVGCGTTRGPAGYLGASPDAIGTKLLIPQVTARSCRTSVLGVTVGDGTASLAASVAELLRRDPEANVVTNAEITWQTVVTGVYNRQCIELRGDVARLTSTIVLPMPDMPSGHHH